MNFDFKNLCFISENYLEKISFKRMTESFSLIKYQQVQDCFSV